MCEHGRAQLHGYLQYAKMTCFLVLWRVWTIDEDVEHKNARADGAWRRKWYSGDITEGPQKLIYGGRVDTHLVGERSQA